jgi:predicted flap endonuclease-1-like 5' DNA nuclease
MFQRWGFLLSEIWVLLAIAALLGLFVGWLIWARSAGAQTDTSAADALRADLAACQSKGRDMAERMAALEREAAKPVAAPAMAAPVMAAPVLAAPAIAAPAAPVATVNAGTKQKPAALDSARGGKPDDLKLIKGIGPKLEILCHSLGFFHFDQMANWSAAEIAWVDENLEGFKGRVTRDEWVQQARDLAAGMAPRSGGEN